jgi:hypothetical protein
MSINVRLDWDGFKEIVESKAMRMQYSEDVSRYDIFSIDHSLIYETTIWKSSHEPVGSDTGAIAADRTDWENNFKSRANDRIADQASQPVFIRKEIPPKSAKIRIMARSEIVGSVDSDYVIPDGYRLHITDFQCASTLAIGVLASNRVQLFHDPNGNGIGMGVLSTLYPTASNHFVEVNEVFTGNGTAKIKIRRTPLDAGSREVFVQWEGYLTNGVLT